MSSNITAINVLQEEIADLKHEIIELKQENNHLKNIAEDLKHEIIELKQENSNLKNIAEDYNILKGKPIDNDTKAQLIDNDLSLIENTNSDLLAEIKSKIESFKDDFRQYGLTNSICINSDDRLLFSHGLADNYINIISKLYVDKPVLLEKEYKTFIVKLDNCYKKMMLDVKQYIDTQTLSDK